MPPCMRNKQAADHLIALGILPWGFICSIEQCFQTVLCVHIAD